eukprot:1847071-Rhodomonas_salina.1
MVLADECTCTDSNVEQLEKVVRFTPYLRWSEPETSAEVADDSSVVDRRSRILIERSEGVDDADIDPHVDGICNQLPVVQTLICVFGPAKEAATHRALTPGPVDVGQKIPDPAHPSTRELRSRSQRHVQHRR